MRSGTSSFAGSEGRVAYRWWRPAGVVRRLVVVVHGYAEHGGRYAHLAEHLVGHDAAVYAPDHLGHGFSDGERALIADFEHVVDDLETLVEIARAEPDIGAAPLVVIGHSMGGLLCARFAQRNSDAAAGLVFLGAVLGDWPWAREVLALPELPAVDSDPYGMSRDLEVCRTYADDPLVYHGTYRRELLEAEVACLDRMRSELGRVTAPVLFLHGAEDPFVPYGPSLAAVQGMASRDVTEKLYAGAKHELVNETNRDEVMADVANFVERVTC
ncbi:MAG: lysophospholipase [Acidimicrobiia bacterium]|nr:lysophospholipase [Acidimicrobiia bacterium]